MKRGWVLLIFSIIIFSSISIYSTAISCTSGDCSPVCNPGYACSDPQNYGICQCNPVCNNDNICGNVPGENCNVCGNAGKNDCPCSGGTTCLESTPSAGDWSCRAGACISSPDGFCDVVGGERPGMCSDCVSCPVVDAVDCQTSPLQSRICKSQGSYLVWQQWVSCPANANACWAQDSSHNFCAVAPSLNVQTNPPSSILENSQFSFVINSTGGISGVQVSGGNNPSKILNCPTPSAQTPVSLISCTITITDTIPTAGSYTYTVTAIGYDTTSLSKSVSVNVNCQSGSYKCSISPVTASFCSGGVWLSPQACVSIPDPVCPTSVSLKTYSASCTGGGGCYYPSNTQSCTPNVCGLDISTNKNACVVCTQGSVMCSDSTHTQSCSNNQWGAPTFCSNGCNSATGACNGCVPTTCGAQGANCGTIPNGCGTGNLNCGSCTSPATCGGGGTANVCGTTCTPETNASFCSHLGKNCGTVTGTDNCGNTSRTVSSCGTCTSPATCGGAGTTNVCGTSCSSTCSSAQFVANARQCNNNVVEQCLQPVGGCYQWQSVLTCSVPTAYCLASNPSCVECRDTSDCSLDKACDVGSHTCISYSLSASASSLTPKVGDTLLFTPMLIPTISGITYNYVFVDSTGGATQIIALVLCCLVAMLVLIVCC